MRPRMSRSSHIQCLRDNFNIARIENSRCSKPHLKDFIVCALADSGKTKSFSKSPSKLATRAACARMSNLPDARILIT